jgi:cytochrome c-type biogenesis protein CcmF
MQYVGEHLWLGQIGHFLVLLGFVAAILSATSYAMSTLPKNTGDSGSLLKLGRWAFYIHGFAMLSVIGLLFYGMYNHMYEYAYIFDHVSEELPMRYILSAFWGGQEGSFLLWIFWHVILGFIMIRYEKVLESRFMFVFAVVEVVITSMVLGIHINFGDTLYKIGSSPFSLIRQTMEAPIFNNADYLSLIKGRGLNPLLQNYWMTIHPPTLFLGFASTLIPFAYAIAGLWANDHKEWIKRSMSWSLFSAGILGTGILMGALWAYVALTFGGYWAWDPVENASLVPWITLVAGIHVHLIYRQTGHSAKSIYIFYIISFVLILYSTFLTRSGVLGDTSAHAFTEMGLEWQLFGMVAIFALLGFSFLAYRWKSIPTLQKEEELYSREFWMFIGSLVLIFSAVLITVSTSLPVFNKIVTFFEPDYAGRVIKDPIGHYNKYQLWIGVFASILSGVAVWMRYKGALWNEQKQKFLKRIAMHVIVASVLTALTALWIDLPAWQFIALCFTGYYTVVANLDYIISIVKGKIKTAYSAIAHIGFGLMVVGTIASGLNQKSISSNPFVFKEIFSAEDVKKYVQLIKGRPLFSQGYFITYQDDTLIGRERYYNINFKQIDSTMKVTDEFTLRPNALYANDFSKIAAYNPDTKHLISKDIFTAVMKVPPAVESAEAAKQIEDTLTYNTAKLAIGDTITVDGKIIKILGLSYNPTNAEYLKNTHDAGIGVNIAITDTKQDTTYYSEATIGLQGALMYTYPAMVDDVGMRFKINENSVEKYFTSEEKLDYKTYTTKAGESINIDGRIVTISGFEKDPKNSKYKKEEGDIAIAAKIDIKYGDKTNSMTPLYVIRNSQPMSIKEYDSNSGMHVRFSNIDPEKEEFSFKIATNVAPPPIIDLDIAKDVPRSDYIILMASIFPGINLFWLGSILMMLGLFMAAYDRLKLRFQ